MLSEQLQKSLRAAHDTLRKAERAKAEADAAVEQARKTYESLVYKGKNDALDFVIKSGLPLPR